MFVPDYRSPPRPKLRFGSTLGSSTLGRSTLGSCALALGVAGAVGCGGSAESFESEGAAGLRLDSAGLEARVEIERSRSLDQEEDARGEALAQFALIPASWYESDRQTALARAGLRRAMPAIGHCELDDDALGSEGNSRLALMGAEALGVEPVELLAAGDVRIEAGGHTTLLSLHGFPLSGVASGVLYTTRDRAAEPLPNAARYAIEVEGSSEVPRLSLLADAPAALEAVSIAGEPLSQLETIVASEALELTWEQGEPGDIVYVDLASAEEHAVCAFADEQGTGAVPEEMMTAWLDGGELKLSVHRVRQELGSPVASSEFEPGLAAVVRFDFAVHRTVEAQAGD